MRGPCDVHIKFVHILEVHNKIEAHYLQDGNKIGMVLRLHSRIGSRMASRMVPHVMKQFMLVSRMLPRITSRMASKMVPRSPNMTTFI